MEQCGQLGCCFSLPGLLGPSKAPRRTDQELVIQPEAERPCSLCRYAAIAGFLDKFNRQNFWCLCRHLDSLQHS